MSDQTRAAMIADLEMVVGTLSMTFDGLREECEKHGAEFTKEQEARWEGGFMALRAVLADDLRPMLEAWKAGGQFSREGERIARTGEYKPADLLEMNERGEAS